MKEDRQSINACPPLRMSPEELVPSPWHLKHRIVFMLDRRKLRGHRKKSDKKDQALRIKSTEPEHDQIKNQAHGHG